MPPEDTPLPGSQKLGTGNWTCMKDIGGAEIICENNETNDRIVMFDDGFDINVSKG